MLKLILFCFILATQLLEINAQPIGGTMYLNASSGSDSSEIITRIYYKNHSAVPDSILLKPNNSNDTLWVHIASSELLTDSIHKVDFISLYHFKNMTTAQAETDSLFLYAQMYDPMFPGNTTYRSTQFLPPVIYHNPHEKLNFSLFQSQDSFPTISFPLLFLQYNISGDAKSKGVRIHTLTGQTIWNRPDSFGQYSFHITSKQKSNHFEDYTSNIYTTIIADSNIKSSFSYDTAQVDSLGFVRTFAELNQPAIFKLCYIDKEADSVNIAQYSPLNMIGNIALQTTTITDSTFIEFTLPVSVDVLNSLPAAVNIIVTPYHSGKCFPRNFSFNIEKRTNNLGSLELAKTNFDFTIYPNPADTKLSIYDPKASIDCIKIYDIMGKQHAVEYIRENNNLIINTVELSDGIYFLTIESEKDHIVHKVFISSN